MITEYHGRKLLTPVERLGNSRYTAKDGLCIADENGVILLDVEMKPIQDREHQRPRPPAVTPERFIARPVQNWSAHETGSSVVA